ncbi:MAG: hypothetical protein KatS3mg024_0156 [Armatimonadota bacterium]|nr:MAG: hypothetical protein KatS3mg024_0156 [Armatimonadota bacterium]
MNGLPDYPAGMLWEFVRRSYLAADGLWFLRCEEELGYGEALRLDELVWRTMPRLQARWARELLGLEGSGLEPLSQALGLKLTAEGHSFETSLTGTELWIEVTECPWLEAIRRSGRESIAADICGRICEPEMGLWAEQFGCAGCVFTSRLSEGTPRCRLVFRKG